MNRTQRLSLALFQAPIPSPVLALSGLQKKSMMKAMGTGIPVIGARARGLAEYIKHDENGYLVEPHDYQTLADKILFLYQHPEERTRLGQGSIATVAQFSRTKIAEEWQNLYKEVLQTYNQKKK